MTNTSHSIPVRRPRRVAGVFLALAASSAAFAAGETIDWYTTDSGGGSSSGGGYTITGTAGQADAYAVLTSGAMGPQIAGGFWAGVQPPQAGGNGLFSDSFE